MSSPRPAKGWRRAIQREPKKVGSPCRESRRPLKPLMNAEAADLSICGESASHEC